ncbi:hypothetical protein Y887_16515 [Xanthomonas pisi DSM 18956]|uniref:Uncharacterized protein n=1 Tax=Xanthomonas pisi TaxID=56457 RepID=A0A2S7CY94_9XANT|nr:hypothetical protein Y887_16515 [Xanthomonas pisi DSM 18956]PPU66568.1 hypothetical protein XpiCFBP4643_18790 [Xanthomonas pisi]
MTAGAGQPGLWAQFPEGTRLPSAFLTDFLHSVDIPAVGGLRNPRGQTIEAFQAMDSGVWQMCTTVLIISDVEIDQPR